MPGRASVGELVAMGVIAGLVAFGLAYATGPHRTSRPPVRAGTALETRAALFELRAAAGRVLVRSRDGALTQDIELAVVVDGAPHRLAIAREDLRSGPGLLRAVVLLPLGDTNVEASLELRADPPHDALWLTLTGSPVDRAESEAGGDNPVHMVALRAEVSSQGQTVFVSGVGQLADRATITGESLLFDSEPHPMGIVSPAGALTIDALVEDPSLPADLMQVAATSPARPLGEEHLADLRIALGQSSATIWRSLAELAGVPIARVRGRVTGTTDRAIVFARDAQGSPLLRLHAADDGSFDVLAPMTAVQWYAAIEPGRASPIVTHTPGTPQQLVLDVSPGGDLHVVIIDADGRKPLTARLVVHGIDGTVDPSFGPDYRASGAGPIMDALRGDVMTPLPSGRYRVAATKGIEWSIDAQIVDILPGRTTDVELAPRHVVPTPGVLGCDLHVHARPSFDTPVTSEDRVISLVAAGIDFAVPTEHNLVGDYTSSLETLDLRGHLLSVTGVEVTTYNKGFGHFGVFPYPPWLPVPPFKHTTMGAIFHAVRTGDSNRYFQLNHPRLPKGIGYFGNIGFDPKAPRSRIHSRIDFDGIEVYNGYDTERPERVEQVLRDYWALLDYGWHYTATGSSDSHRIQYHWAGYPRTMVSVDPNATPESDTKPVDPLTVVANIKRGHATVTSGPIIELELGGVRPGDDLTTGEDPIRGHLRVRAAPWIDVTRVEIVVGNTGGVPGANVVGTFDVASRPTQLGQEPGTLEQAGERTIRLDRDIEVPIGPENTWVQVIVRGERRMDDVLPFMPVPPFGFTNPVYVVRRPRPAPPYPQVLRPSLPSSP